MTTRTITFDDGGAIAYLEQLAARMADLTPVMQDLGEYLVASTKARFSSSTAPDGSHWAVNSPVTLGRYLSNYGGMFKKSGGLTKDGEAKASAKKPLIGQTGQGGLGDTIHAIATANSVTVGSSLIYAGVQQFGAARHSLGQNTPWGDIPARPYLGLSLTDRGNILSIVRDHLDKA